MTLSIYTTEALYIGTTRVSLEYTPPVRSEYTLDRASAHHTSDLMTMMSKSLMSNTVTVSTSIYFCKDIYDNGVYLYSGPSIRMLCRTNR